MLMHHLLRSLLLLALFMPLAGQAVTLGEARVKSYLNQPLDVEIPLIGLAPEQHQDLRLRIANPEHFDRLGIAYERFHGDLKFDVVRSGGRWIVRARSERLMSEPFIDFPLQMTWPGGQMVKQYTLLLDPQTRVQTARAASTGRAATPPEAARTPAGSGPDLDSYGPVSRGETLWPIAQRLKPAGITTQQMAMALLRANPQAFIDNNVNKLRAGAVLSIPSRAFIERLDAATARAEFVAQSRRFQAPVATSPRELAAAASAPTAGSPAGQAGAGAAQQDATLQDTGDDDQLRIVTAAKDEEGGESESEQDLRDQLLITMEEIESNRITTAAIESRLGRLESELDRMQKLVELKDAQIAALQSELSAREAIQQAAQASEPAPPAAAVPRLPEGLQSAAGDQAVTLPPDAPRTAAVTLNADPPLQAAATPRAGAPWYERYLGLFWAALGLLGLSALLLMLGRPRPDEDEAVMADLAPAGHAAAAAAYAPPPPREEMQRAAADFREPVPEPPPQPQPAYRGDTEDLPAFEIDSGREAPATKTGGGLTNSLLDEMIDESKLLADHPEPPAARAEYNDDEIASWVAELDAEADRVVSDDASGSKAEASRSANDEQVPLDDEVPSLLTELDDQLGSAEHDDAPQPADIDLEPADTPSAEDTFSMSLDLARAYLEIGDQDGARDMLKQALSSTRDPDHRRQIEELLQQID